MTTPWTAAPDRYDSMTYRRCGRSGLDLPALSLGLWHNFGDTKPFETQRAILRRAFDLGITHIDLANNYGPPYGSAEENFGRALALDLRPYRDELIISTKAGYDMWPGPYGDGGSRKYLLSSLDQSLRRMGLDYVDIFYSHRFDPTTPLEETMGALHTAVVSGRALYAGVSSYSPSQTREAARILADLGTPLLIHQPSYSMFNRHVEHVADGEVETLLDAVEDLGVGTIVFSPLQQGLLTGRYLSGEVPADSRAAVGHFLKAERISDEYLARARTLDDVATARGQSLAQLALRWVLRDQRVTSALIGASSVAQLEDNVAALSGPDLTDDELAAIEPHAVDGTGR
ncbi:L-glyceraldehyde 3-phosphate reductase [Cellulomonas carbonis]|uniref:Aldo/keto reductase n=1 Tax=Cellulomonas carbonis T26 TaxID=947969 RepID=A0A0A0BLL9_9CELL|nr:L-glyceraldehyde 3-phosphate reductase [Cellulomonas carbonis]KGM08856.1 aldo/keto reductase [Cellulomonas carbonis T26]GGC08504.1 glyceraldehyde 3-phosphate reductase [Cellulomonas carbonis]